MIYNKAHELAKELKESPEFKKYKELTIEVNKDEKNREMLADYRKKMMELQIANIQTGEIDQEKLKELQDVEQILMLNSKLKEFLMAELEFSKIYADVNKIISDAIEVEE